MSLAGFQRALSALVMSPALRAEVAALPEPELPAQFVGLELTERERRRLHALARDAGMKVTTLLHRANRLSMLTNTLPRTSEAMAHPKLQPLVQRYWRENPPTSVMYVREARRFAGFLQGLLRSGELVHPPLAELLEAELALLELGKSGLALPSVPESPPEGDALEAARPRLGPWCRVLPFRMDPRMLPRSGGAVSLPESLPDEERYLLLTSVSPGQVVPRALEVTRARVLRASTGQHSVAALRTELGCPSSLFLELAREGLLLLGPAQ
ncbi:MAG TPA: hypothetical protein VFZ09_02910 [Archangium sp.]|uniref:hypothetical protein n=1 Tax=Archangium sp. TaxID=1872627 RepID=UPI002E3322FD|nr:hypothetical protein [Archangium sp.]HEX5745164.1 hypothetical protein [Archangium sp.]